MFDCEELSRYAYLYSICLDKRAQLLYYRSNVHYVCI